VTTGELQGQAAIVAGGASGIGAATARLMATAGASVAIADRNEPAAKALAADIVAAGGRAEAFALDVADEQSVDGAIAAAHRAFGRLDILVNSAGLSIRKAAFDIPMADWDAVQAVNVRGTFLCARAAAKLMDRARGGAIVNLASIMGFSGGGLYPNPAYLASKGAVVNLTRALAVEWAPLKIRVNAVAPAWVRTPFIGQLQDDPELLARIEAATPIPRLVEPEEVARAVLFLASPAASMTTGHILAVDGGYLAI
jgi:NAD(P)-dependent dehydrogenase (short-subunit alcohol dehydrogenase family)